MVGPRRGPDEFYAHATRGPPIMIRVAVASSCASGRPVAAFECAAAVQSSLSALQGQVIWWIYLLDASAGQFTRMARTRTWWARKKSVPAPARGRR